MSRRSDTALLERNERGIERSKIAQLARMGLMEYEAALSWQSERAEAVSRGALPEVVALLEHPPIYTQGRRGGREHVLEPLRAPIVDTDRGGDVTFHGPGQLVVWPILRIRERGIGIARYVRALEQVAIETTGHFGVEAERARGRPGVWIENRKLASIGVRVQSGVSRHGLALNCETDLSWFGSIRACGVEGGVPTSLSAETGRSVGVDEAGDVLSRTFAEVFQLKLSATQETAELP